MDLTNNIYFGKLGVHVTSADEAIPIPDATVVVRRTDEGSDEVIAVLVTGESGETEEIFIPAPSPSLSLTPSPLSAPYATVSIEVLADGYYPTVNTGVPVFSGVTTVQKINLIAYPEGAPRDLPNVIVVESCAPEF